MSEKEELPSIVGINPEELRSRQTRSEMNPSKVNKIRKKIRKKGFDPNQPIEAVEVNGTYLMHDEHHRVEAATREKLGKVPVRINKVTAEEAVQYRLEAIEAEEENKGF